MPIIALLKIEGFDPEAVEELRVAFENCLKEFDLVDRSDPITVLVAQEIVRLARLGIGDKDEICKMAIAKLRRISDWSASFKPALGSGMVATRNLDLISSAGARSS